MTSEMTQLKPVLPPKPTKYRAPVPPRPQPPSCQQRLHQQQQQPVERTADAAAAVADRIPQPAPGDDSPPSSKKYRAPQPPATPPCAAAATSPGRVSTMRREPMQVVITSNIIRYGDRSAASSSNDNSSGSPRVSASSPPPSSPTRCHDDASVPGNGRVPASPSHCGGVDIWSKPVVTDVKLLPRDANARLTFRSRNRYAQPSPQQPQQQSMRSWRSTESVERLNVLAELSTTSPPVGPPPPPCSARSSFVDPAAAPCSGPGGPAGGGAATRRSVYIDLGEYQTLLKHGREDAVYSLPQPQCYGDDTLRAVRLITEKYDTFKRRQLRALSFRDGSVRSGFRQQIAEGVEVVNDHSQNTYANTTGNGTGGGAAPSTSVDVGSTVQPTSGDVSDSDRRAPPPPPVGPDDAMSKCSVSPPPSATLSRCIMSLSRYGLETGLSASSVDDVTLLTEIDAAAAVDAEDADDDDDVDGGRLTKTDRLRVEMFYRSRETEVYVCGCLADLLVGACSPATGPAAAADDDPSRWVHVHTGVPVWLLNTGRGVRRRELLIVLAERRTGFPLWQDRISYLSDYGPTTTTAEDRGTGGGGRVRRRPSCVHQMRLASSLSKAVRLCMFARRPAAAFLARFRQFTVDPNDDLWKISEQSTNAGAGKEAVQRRRRRGRRNSAASKAAISQPCSVVLVSHVDLRHPNFRAAFADLLPPATVGRPTSLPAAAVAAAEDDDDGAPPPAGSAAGVEGQTDDDCEFRPRLPTR